MKNINIKTVALIAGIGLLSSCGENAWNDHLDGFQEPPVYSKVETIDYALSAADYKTIASNSSNKALAADKGLDAELAAIGTNGYFSTSEEARLFIPAFISDSSFPYFTLNNGSSVKITYDLVSNQPENVIAINNGVLTYKVSEANYQEAWDSDENFINAFAPAAPASASIPEILKAEFPDATTGQYAVVTYNEATSNPDFGSAGGPKVYIDETFEADQGAFIIENTLLPEGLKYVWAYAQGYGMKASAFANKTNFDSESWLISPEIKLSKEANASLSFDQALNFFSSLEEAAEQATVNVREVGGAWTTLAVPTMPDKLSWTFVSSGAIDLSAYNGKIIQIGFCYKSTAAKAGTWEVKNVRVADNENTKAGTRADANVVTEEKNAIYLFNASSGWTEPSSMLVLQPSDYSAMGQKYGNLSGTNPEDLLPTYLNMTLPYAADDESTVVVYKYYNGSSTSYKASQFTKTDGVWMINKGATIDKFTRKDGNWAFNPSVEMVLPYSRNTDPTYSYFMACKDWVFNNVTLKLYPDATPATGSRPGPPFIDYRDNAEFYSGCSAYYGNVDVRASTAVSNAPEGYTAYDGLTDDQISELLKKRFCTETFPGALSIMHPDADVVEGMDVTYSFKFTAYITGGSAVEYTMVYKVVGKGQFEFVSCDWWENGKPAE